jgi:NTP pyrophosphatase (non-canonical NTP hydrolase)
MNHWQDNAINDVRLERDRQDEKWGSNRNLSQLFWCAILGEEVGEVNKAVLERDREGYRAELVQVAAVCVAAVENYDREEYVKARTAREAT